DESWMQEIWEWADRYEINEDTIPRSRIDLLGLESLSVYSINFLPESIGNLVNLTYLEVSFGGFSPNMLTSLPENIGNLINLRTLNVSDTKLTSLPKSIGNLVNLTSLDVSSNELTSLP